MAFSFRAGTNWCHDFPKLARDSGFYFNMHRTRVRVDWNRICSLNIDQVVRESDFQTVDDNVNNVIDYSLEQEYDVKILDPNFVKLFRLAQLAVEYLLYCKQYLDQSVIILKDELKLKIEENVKLRKDIASMNECIRDLKEKNKSLDLRISPHGEVHKCPYCPKSFISAMYVNAHISRRHSTSSPSPDEYKNETEKLHNEIKTLKERLNQTEKLISESNKWTESKNVDVEKVDKAENTEESSLKVSVSKSEKPEKLSEEVNKSSEDANKTLISELKLRMESDMESVQAKLTEQENYWKIKMETMESQHHVDIENLSSQLKLTQQAASRMKTEYEYKIKDLERQSLSQSDMINAQTEMLHNLSRGIQDFRTVQKTESAKEEHKERQNKIPSKLPEQEHISSQEISDSLMESNSDSVVESVRHKLEPKNRLREETKAKVKPQKTKAKREEKEKRQGKSSDLIDEFVKQTSRKLKSSGVTKKKETTNDQDSESKESCSEEQSETASETEDSETPTTETKTESEVSETVTEETITDDDHERRKKAVKSVEPPAVSDDLKEDMREIFNRKMQNLGIDPDWEGIPKATFKHKSNMLRHHQSINAKKYPKYMNIRERLLLELSKKLNSRHKERSKTPMKQGLLSKVKSKAMKAFNIQQRNPKPQVVQKQITHPRRTNPQQAFASNRTRKMSYDEVEFRRNLNKDVPTRASDPQLHKRNPEPNLSETPTKIQKHASYETIEDFIRGSRKLELTGTRATSTPMKNTNNFMQQSYDYENDEILASSFMSPKGGKSVLKSHSGSGTLTKKKVEFDLENRRSVSAEPMRTISFGEVTEYGLERENSVESDLNLSSVSEDKSPPKRMEQLNVGSRKSTTISDTSNLSSPTIEIEDFDRSSTKNVRSPIQARERNLRAPQAAPRNLTRSSVRKSVPDSSMSNLEADIEDILQIS